MIGLGQIVWGNRYNTCHLFVAIAEGLYARDWLLLVVVRHVVLYKMKSIDPNAAIIDAWFGSDVDRVGFRSSCVVRQKRGRDVLYKPTIHLNLPYDGALTIVAPRTGALYVCISAQPSLSPQVGKRGCTLTRSCISASKMD